MSTVDDLIAEWRIYKDAEKESANHRRDIEDELLKIFGVDTAKEGTESIELDGGMVSIKIAKRLDRKVDSAKVQELAAEYGIEGHLTTLFRWTPEVSVAAWKAADERITNWLAPAITIKPGRPSFTITRKEQ
jgi:hypothetical protein